MSRVHPPTSVRVEVLEGGARPTDRGWYTDPSTWPSASSPASGADDGGGIGREIWACVAADGRLRVFDGRTPSSRTLLHSTPVLGAVLSLALWLEREIAVTLEECDTPHARADRIIRFYSWAQPREREVIELATIELDQPANSRIFSPSLLSLCPHSQTLALSHDTTIKLYDLRDIFCDTSSALVGARPTVMSSNSGAGTTSSIPSDEPEPGAEAKTPSQRVNHHHHHHRQQSTMPALSPSQSQPQPLIRSPTRAIAATFPHTRRYVVKVFQVLPIMTLRTPFSVRHLDYKQAYLTYSSYNECRLLFIHLERLQPNQRLANDPHFFSSSHPPHHRATASFDGRLRTLSFQSQSSPSPQSSPMSAPPPGTSTRRASPSMSQRAGGPRAQQSSAGASPASATSAGIGIGGGSGSVTSGDASFELLGARFDTELQVDLRDDIVLRRVDLLLHRRGGPADQIHTVRLIPPPAPKHHANINNNKTSTTRTGGGSTIASPSHHAISPGAHARTGSFVGVSPRHPQASLSPSPAPAPASSPTAAGGSSLTPKQELFALLSQGLPMTPMTGFGDPTTSLPSYSQHAHSYSSMGPSHSSASSVAVGVGHHHRVVSSTFVPSASFQHGGVTVELMDDEDEDSCAASEAQSQEILFKLEALADEAEQEDMAMRRHRRQRAPDDTASATSSPTTAAATHESSAEIGPSSPSSASTNSSRASAPSDSIRTNGHIYLPMRLLISNIEACHLYDVESCTRLVTYYFEHDLVSLQTRGSFLIALTTHGLEIFALWFDHPMKQFLILPHRIVLEEPVISSHGPVSKVQDMIVLDTCILLRPASANSQSSSSSSSSSLSSSLSSRELIVPTDDMDPCESWPAFPVRVLPRVTEVVVDDLQPLAAKAQAQAQAQAQAHSHVSPATKRLYTESLLMLIQRCAQLHHALQRAEQHSSRSAHGEEGSSASASVSASVSVSAPTSASIIVARLRHEHAEVVRLLADTNHQLFRLFLDARDLGLACFFAFYDTADTDADTDADALSAQWEVLQHACHERTRHEHDYGRGGGGTGVGASHHLTKYLIKVLVGASLPERRTLATRPELIRAFVAHFAEHAPHLVGHVLLKTYLLACPYDPRAILQILDDTGARSNYGGGSGGALDLASSASSGVTSYRTSRTQSSSGTPTGVPSNGGGVAVQRVRPVVFHTFVKALMLLQLSETSGGSTKDSASILIHTFSTHSLELLLLTHPALLISWPHRHVLVDFLRSSVPWSLLEVLVQLTQRGAIDVECGVELLLGRHAAESVIDMVTGRRHEQSTHVAHDGPNHEQHPPSHPPHHHSPLHASPNFPFVQLQAYLECSLNPFMLPSIVAARLESESGSGSGSEDDTPLIEPWDTARSKSRYIIDATRTGDVTDDDDDEGDQPFVLSVRGQVLHSSHAAAATSNITRRQVGKIATLLACVYLQYGFGPTAATTTATTSSAVSGSSTSSIGSSLSRPSVGVRRSMSNYNGLASSSQPAATVTAATISNSHVASPTADFTTRHALVPWWHAAWMDAIAGGGGGTGSDAKGALALAVHSNDAPVTEDTVESRLHRLQAILTSPLPLTRSQCQHILARLLALDCSHHAMLISMKSILLMSLLPRIGDLPSALRLVSSHSPETLWRYGQIYCSAMVRGGGEEDDADLIDRVDASELRARKSAVLSHWQVYHAILLLNILHSTHSTAVLAQHAPTLLPPAGYKDAIAERALLEPILPNYLVETLLAPKADYGCPELQSYGTSATLTSLTPIDRANMYHHHYVYLLSQLLVRCRPSDFLSFIPPLGCARFYLRYVKMNFEYHSIPPSPYPPTVPSATNLNPLRPGSQPAPTQTHSRHPSHQRTSMNFPTMRQLL